MKITKASEAETFAGAANRFTNPGRIETLANGADGTQAQRGEHVSDREYGR